MWCACVQVRLVRRGVGVAGMPKTYLRYVQERACGVIASPMGNVVVDATGTYACAPALEDVGVWMLKTGRQVRAGWRL